MKTDQPTTAKHETTESGHVTGIVKQQKMVSASEARMRENKSFLFDLVLDPEQLKDWDKKVAPQKYARVFKPNVNVRRKQENVLVTPLLEENDSGSESDFDDEGDANKLQNQDEQQQDAQKEKNEETNSNND